MQHHRKLKTMYTLRYSNVDREVTICNLCQQHCITYGAYIKTIFQQNITSNRKTQKEVLIRQIFICEGYLEVQTCSEIQFGILQNVSKVKLVLYLGKI